MIYREPISGLKVQIVMHEETLDVSTYPEMETEPAVVGRWFRTGGGQDAVPADGDPEYHVMKILTEPEGKFVTVIRCE